MRVYRSSQDFAERLHERRYLAKYRWHYERQHKAMEHPRVCVRFVKGHVYVGCQSGHRRQESRYRRSLERCANDRRNRDYENKYES
jgi:hypothetical protein